MILDLDYERGYKKTWKNMYDVSFAMGRKETSIHGLLAFMFFKLV